MDVCERLNKMPVVSREVVVINELGLHVRPAGTIVKTANRFKSKVTIHNEDETVDGKSIMGVMMLGASKGTVLRIQADGEDAEEAIATLEALFINGFGELETSQGSTGGH